MFDWMVDGRGGLSSTGVQFLIYLGLGLFALFLCIAIMTSVMGKNKAKKKSSSSKAQPKPSVDDSTPNMASATPPKGGKECCECDCIEDKQRTEVKTPQVQEATNQQEPHPPPIKEESSYDELKNYMEMTNKKTSPQKKPRKIHMPKNTGGG